MHIAHHFPQKELISRGLVNYQFLKQNSIEHVSETDIYDLEYLSKSCMDVFFYTAYLAEDRDNKNLRDFIDALTARLNISVNIGNSISYNFQNKNIDITPSQRDYKVSTHLWNMAFFGAVILDDREILKTLLSINLDNLVTASGGKKDYTYSMALALKAFYDKQKDYPELLNKALQENMDVAKNNDKAMDIDGPALELLYLLLLERNDEFNDRLLKALEWHKKYCLRLQKKNILYNIGLVSLPICAMTKLAKKLKKIPINHSSYYLPEYLLEV